MKFAAIFSVFFVVLLSLTSGGVVRRGDSSEDLTGVHLVHDVISGVKLINENLESLNSRVGDLELENQILLREAGFMRVHQLQMARRINKHLSSTPSPGPGHVKAKGSIALVLNKLKSTKDGQDRVHTKLDNIKRESKELFQRVASLQEKLQNEVTKHLKMTPKMYQEKVEEVLEAIKGVQEKQDSMNRKIDKIQKENKDLWKEAVSLKNKNKKKIAKGTPYLIIDPMPTATVKPEDGTPYLIIDPMPTATVKPEDGTTPYLIIDPMPTATVKPEDEDPDILDAAEPSQLLSHYDIPWLQIWLFAGGIGIIIVALVFALFKIIGSLKSYEPI